MKLFFISGFSFAGERRITAIFSLHFLLLQKNILVAQNTISLLSIKYNYLVKLAEVQYLFDGNSLSHLSQFPNSTFASTNAILTSKIIIKPIKKISSLFIYFSCFNPFKQVFIAIQITSKNNILLEGNIKLKNSLSLFDQHKLDLNLVPLLLLQDDYEILIYAQIHVNINQ